MTGQFIEQDLKLLWSILNYIHNPPKKHSRYVKWIHSNILVKAISKYPWKDIVAVVWFFFFLGIIELKWKHWWIVVPNVGVCIAMRCILAMKRPVEYDIRLQPLTDKAAGSFGFPSVESYMSVVVMGHLYKYKYTSIFFLIISILVVFAVGFSRVYARSRFPHQIVCSWMAGFVGLLLGEVFYGYMRFEKMNKQSHHTVIVLSLILIAINVAITMENNDSRLLYVPKKEFARVMNGIINGGSKDAVTEAIREMQMEYDEPFDAANPTSIRLISQSPRTLAMEELQDLRGNNNTSIAGGLGAMGRATSRRLKRGVGGFVKSDSLFFLQKQMMHREERERLLRHDFELSGSLSLSPEALKKYGLGPLSGKETQEREEGVMGMLGSAAADYTTSRGFGIGLGGFGQGGLDGYDNDNKEKKKIRQRRADVDRKGSGVKASRRIRVLEELEEEERQMREEADAMFINNAT